MPPSTTCLQLFQSPSLTQPHPSNPSTPSTLPKPPPQNTAVPLDGSIEEWEQPRPLCLRGWLGETPALGADTIIRHRYSDPGTEPAPAKLSALRTAAPGVLRHDAEATRAALGASLKSYCAVKARAMFGSQFKLV